MAVECKLQNKFLLCLTFSCGTLSTSNYLLLLFWPDISINIPLNVKRVINATNLKIKIPIFLISNWKYPPYMCGSKFLRGGGGTGKNQNWCLENPGSPVKTGVFGNFFAKMLKNIKKGLLYAENSEKYLFFKKFYPPHHPLNFFRPLEGGWNSPPP